MQEGHNEFKIGFGFCIGPCTIVPDRGAPPVLPTAMVTYGQDNGTAEENQTQSMMTNKNLSAAATIP